MADKDAGEQAVVDTSDDEHADKEERESEEEEQAEQISKKMADADKELTENEDSDVARNQEEQAEHILKEMVEADKELTENEDSDVNQEEEESDKELTENGEEKMSHDLVLKPKCSKCGSTTDLYGSNCKHMTLCLTCGKSWALNRAKCYECDAILTHLIREYPVRVSSSVDENYCIGGFASGLPIFSKKNAKNKWFLQREGLVGCPQVTDLLQDKVKKKPWLLEDESQKSQYRGHPEGTRSSTYYLLMMEGKEFNVIPAGSWYDFKKVAQYDQFTLEEAEEKMENKSKGAVGCEILIMKAVEDGPAAFAEGVKFDEPEIRGLTEMKGRRNKKKNEDNASDKGHDEGDDESGRKNNLKKGGQREDKFDLDDEIEKGDDWEHDDEEEEERLPMAIVVLIISKLPPRLICRCKMLSKAIKEEIEAPGFYNPLGFSTGIAYALNPSSEGLILIGVVRLQEIMRHLFAPTPPPLIISRKLRFSIQWDVGLEPIHVRNVIYSILGDQLLLGVESTAENSKRKRLFLANIRGGIEEILHNFSHGDFFLHHSSGASVIGSVVTRLGEIDITLYKHHRWEQTVTVNSPERCSKCVYKDGHLFRLGGEDEFELYKLDLDEELEFVYVCGVQLPYELGRLHIVHLGGDTKAFANVGIISGNIQLFVENALLVWRLIKPYNYTCIPISYIHTSEMMLILETEWGEEDQDEQINRFKFHLLEEGVIKEGPFVFLDGYTSTQTMFLGEANGDDNTG